jgi:hypothetical protein
MGGSLVNITLVSPFGAKGEPKRVALTPFDKWLGLYGHLFPEHEMSHVHPDRVGVHVENHVTDLCLLHTTRDPVQTEAMLAWCRQVVDTPLAHRPVIVLMESDPPIQWIHWTPRHVQAELVLIDTVDAVCTKNDEYVELYRAFTDTPVRLIREPSNSASYGEFDTSIAGRDWILTPNAVTNQGCWHRGAVLNYAIMKRIAEKHPGLRYGVIHSWGLDVDAEREIQTQMGLSLDMTHPGTSGQWGEGPPSDEQFRTHLADRLRSARAVVHMDMVTAVGHWQVDFASHGVPAVVGPSTAAGAELFPSTTVARRYDVASAVELLDRLITDDLFWTQSSRIAHRRRRHYSVSSVAGEFAELVGALRTRDHR